MPYALTKTATLRGSVYAAGCLAVLAAAPAALAQSGQGFTGAYNVSLIGLSLGTATVSGQVGPSEYKIEAYANLTGLASAVSGAKGSAVSTGSIQNGQIAPAAYATTSANSKETRTVRIGMSAGNVRAVDIQPPFENLEGRVPVMEAHKRSIVDPLSALIMPVKGDVSNGADVCRRSIPVYDGYTRFNVDLAYVGTRRVEVPGYNGNVIVCNARYKPISGHRPNRPATKFMADNKDMEVWLAPLGESKMMVPFRISVRTMVGMTVIEARRFQVSGAAAASR